MIRKTNFWPICDPPRRQLSRRDLCVSGFRSRLIGYWLVKTYSLHIFVARFGWKNSPCCCRCLNEWFGSVEGFETAAMAELASASKAQMGRHVFPWHLGVTMSSVKRKNMMDMNTGMMECMNGTSNWTIDIFDHIYRYILYIYSICKYSFCE